MKSFRSLIIFIFVFQWQQWQISTSPCDTPPSQPTTLDPDPTTPKDDSLADHCISGNDGISYGYDDPVPDCNCKIGSVNHAVRHHLSPLLSNLTERSFFRYFFVDLDKSCPFWHEDGQCVMEGCSVCTCEDTEVPLPWRSVQLSNMDVVSLAKEASNEARNYDDSLAYGWVSSTNSGYGYEGKGHDDSLGRLSTIINGNGDNFYGGGGGGGGGYFMESGGRYSTIRDDEGEGEADEWTCMKKECDIENRNVQSGSYVNLLQNSERY